MEALFGSYNRDEQVTSLRRQQKTRTSEPVNSFGVRLIAVFKLFKGVILFAVGIGARKLLHKDIAFEVDRWTDAFRIDPNNFYIHRLLEKLLFLNSHRLKELSAGTFFYSGLLLTEGTGLLLGKRWGKYFSIIITSSFIPIEVFELTKRISWTRVIVLLINIAIVLYLVFELHRSPEDRSGE